MLNFLRTKEDHDGHLSVFCFFFGCRKEKKKTKTTWQRLGLGLFSALQLLAVPPLFSLSLPRSLANIFSPTLLFAKIQGYHGYQLALYEHLIPHLNIPSYLW